MEKMMRAMGKGKLPGLPGLPGLPQELAGGDGRPRRGRR
jgi:hypothetical protein